MHRGPGFTVALLLVGCGDSSTSTSAGSGGDATIATDATGSPTTVPTSSSSSGGVEGSGETSSAPTTSGTTTEGAAGSTTGGPGGSTGAGSTTDIAGTTEGSSTTEASTCGNGAVDADEQCDDGNATPYDGCEDNCKRSLLDVVGGSAYACALLGSGAVRCWGGNEFGQLGYGNTEDLGDEPGEMPTADLDLGGPALEISAGSRHTCAVLADGAVVCWGRNEYGQLGHGSLEDAGDDPGEMPPPAVPLAAPAVKVAAGAYHSCALLETGAVHCWGRNDVGQLGVGHSEHLGDAPGELPSPEAPVGGVVEQIVAGEVFNCALGAGEVRCWGGDNEGELGTADSVYDDLGDEPGELPVAAVLVGGPVDALDLGLNVACARIGEQIRCWGDGSFGALGSGDVSALGGEIGDMPAPVVPVGGAVIQHVTGFLHTCALMGAGKVRCWGDWGSLGYGTGNDNLGDEPGELPPGDLALGGPVLSLHGGRQFTFARIDDGTLRAWGFNSRGQLGLGNTEAVGDDELPDSVDPVPVF